MAGLYTIIGNSDSSRIKAAVQRLQFFEDEATQIINEPGLTCGWVSQNDASLFGPALDPQTGVRLITSGRVAWDETQWQQAASLNQYQGGLSNRLLLQRYLAGGIAAIERHNGSAVLLIWDPRQQQLHLLTDHFGYYPVFTYHPEQVDGCVIASSADAIADDPAVQTTADYVSMAEFLRQCKAIPPHTYYEEIKYAGVASHLAWDLHRNTYQKREYWRPFESEFFANLPTAAAELAAAVRKSIYIRTLPRLGPITSYTSGGLDSRVILYSAAEPSGLTGVNLYDVPNREAAVAEQLCEAVGAKYVGFARDPDYYPEWMPLGAQYSGAMWSLLHNHFLGTRELICNKLAARTVLSACSTDFLFKYANLDRVQSRCLGYSLPLLGFASEWSGGFVDPPISLNPLPPLFAAPMRQRLREWFGDAPQLRTDLDRLQMQDKRSRPLCYAAGLPLQLMFNAFPYDAFLADRAIADCYSRTPAKWKLNSRLWGAVVVQLCGHTIIDANYSSQPGASNSRKLLAFVREGIKRRIGLTRSIKDQGLATDGSWPDERWTVRHSPCLRQLWQTTPLGDRQVLSELWGGDPWQVPLKQWGASWSSARDFFRLTTLLSYWAVRRGQSAEYEISLLTTRQ